MIIGYLDKCPKNIEIKAQKALLNAYAKERGLKIEIFLSEENISNLESLTPTGGHELLVANVVSLGDSLKSITQNISRLLEKNNKLYIVHENLSFEPNKASNEFIKGLEMAADIRSSMNSIITRNVLHEKRASGQKLGRAFGVKNKKSILNQSGEFIMRSLAQGRTKADIARELNVSWRAVYNVQKQYEVSHA